MEGWVRVITPKNLPENLAFSDVMEETENFMWVQALFLTPKDYK